MQHGLPCMHTLLNSWFNQYEEIYFLNFGHQSHAQKTPPTTAQKISLYNTSVILVLSSLTSARTITHHMEKELTLYRINLTTNCCRARPFIAC